MIKLDTKRIALLQTQITNATGGCAGVRDVTLVDSAINSIYATFDGQDLYPTIEEKGARLGYSIISNHAFLDGNKRTGLHVMLVFLALNDVDLVYTQKELVSLGFGLADGSIKYGALLDWILAHRV